jgi:hypothetical protein
MGKTKGVNYDSHGGGKSGYRLRTTAQKWAAVGTEDCGG